MSVILRPYQTELVTGIRASFARHRRVLAVAPTGAGKTVTFAYITMNAAAKGNSTIVAAHRQEIVDQISRALDAMGVRHGRIQPGHTMTADAVQVAMIQTLGGRLERIPEPDLLVIDEAHHAITGSYAKVCAAWPRARVLGVTATPQRLDGRGLKESFDDMVVGPGTAELIEGGFLAKYRYLAPPEKMDLSGIKTRMGDYAIDELADAMDKAVITGDAIQHYAEHLNGRPSIAFCCTVAHAQHVAEQFQAAGIRAASVDGTMSKPDRRDRIEGIGNGKYQVLTSCALVSEGVDVPSVAGAILLRPTKSLAMYLQSIGRALRLKPDGSDAVILDHVGNVHNFGLPDAPREWSLTPKKKRKVEAVSTCEKCYKVFGSYPGWKAKAECDDGIPTGCILAPAEVEQSERALPEVVDGKLTDFVAPEWSGGLDISKVPLKDALRVAKTEDQLKQLAKARGFKHGWVRHIQNARAAAFGGRAA